MEFTAATIAGFLKGEIVGDPDTIVNTVAKIEEGHEGALSFLANPKYEHYLYTTKSSIVLVNKSLVPSAKVSATMIRVNNAYESFAALLQLVDQTKPRKKGIHPAAVIEPTAKIGTDVYVGALDISGVMELLGVNSQFIPTVILG